MWKYLNGLNLARGFPKWTGHLGVPYGPDAAFLYNGSIIIVKDEEYWHLYEDLDSGEEYVPKGYPKRMDLYFKEV